MKIKHFFGLAVIAAMTASCSSNEDLGTQVLVLTKLVLVMQLSPSTCLLQTALVQLATLNSNQVMRRSMMSRM